LENILIPKQLQKEGFGFVKLKARSKIPVEKDWQNKPYSYVEIQEWIAQGANYGVLGGYGELLPIDSDKPEITEIIKNKFPKTFTVKTPKQGYHSYYFCKGIDKKIVLKKPYPNWLKEKIKNKTDTKEEREKFHYGEIIAKGSQVVGAGSTHPETGMKYQVVNDVPIATISRELIYSEFMEYIPIEYPKKDTETEISNISVDEVLNKAGIQLKEIGGQLVCSHPIHGSTNDNNFVVSTEKNVWHCFRCGSGGGGNLFNCRVGKNN